MTSRRRTALFPFSAVFLLVLVNAASAGAAQRRNADREAAAAAQSLAPASATKAELDAFTVLKDMEDPKARLETADKFMSTYPTTQLVGMVNRIRMDAFLELGRYSEAVIAGRAGLEAEAKFVDGVVKRTEIPAAAPAGSVTVGRRNVPAAAVDKNSPVFKSLINDMNSAAVYSYRQMVTAAQGIPDTAAIIELSEKALALSPDELFFLVTLSNALAERPPAGDKEREQAMKRAEELGRKAVDQVTALVSGAAGAGMPAAQRSTLLNTVHSTMGRVYFNESKYEDAQKSYLAAIAAKKDDSAGYYMLGVAFISRTPPRMSDAMEAFARSVYLKGPTADNARQQLERVYQAQKQSLDGLDQYIRAQGVQLSK